MATAWRGRAWGPSESQSDFYQYTWRPFGAFTQSALRRTLGSCNVMYENPNVGPTNAGSGNGHLYFRVLTTVYPDDPPSGWPSDPDVGDDVLFEPIVWTAAAATPAGWTTGSTPHLYYLGSCIPGTVDVQGQRKFEFGTDPFVHVFVGPLGSRLDSGPATDQFAVAIKLRMLFGDPA